MLKEEFERIAGVQVTPEEYKEIEFVYLWHPSISETEGKMQIATLWTIGGLRLIRDMRDTANVAFHLENEIGETRAKLARLINQMNVLRAGR